MSEPTPRPDPTTLARVSWGCPRCGSTHWRVEPRVDALETADDLLRLGLDWVLLEDATTAEMREADLAERAAHVMNVAPRWRASDLVRAFDPRRYRKG